MSRPPDKPQSNAGEPARPRLRPRVVVIGCGFGGLAAARTLGRDFDVTVVDRTNHHVFQPLLYQVATGGLSATSIASPIRYILRRCDHVHTVMAEVTAIDVERRQVRTDVGEMPYDYLIVAAGAGTWYFGKDEWPHHAPGLKTLDDALRIRNRVLQAFEAAEAEADPAARQALLSFAVVGAGPTGVELAGTLAEIARDTLRAEFRRIDTRRARVMLVEGGPRVLPTFREASSQAAQRQLERLGVDVMCAHRVTGIDDAGLDLSDADGRPLRIDAGTVLWAAGVRASPLGAALAAAADAADAPDAADATDAASTAAPGTTASGATASGAAPRVELDRGGRVVVGPDLSLPGHPEVFVVGDLAALPWHQPPVPGVAPAAKQMGRCAARNIRASVRGAARTPFRYVDYGSLATIGRHAAVAELGSLRLTGWPAWAFWLFVHIFFLIGFRNRFTVMIDWAWSYMTFERFARIITAPRRPERPG
ncbi:MAG: NAD(P)/FAD-dependent oxidoreductase [Burkholderiaceae bacterium]